MPLALFRRSLPPVPEYLDVTHEGETFRVRVRQRAGVKRFTLRVSMVTSEAVLTMPERGNLKAAVRFLEEHSGWIAQRMKRIPDAIAFEVGAIIPFRGVPHRIVHHGGLRGLVNINVDINGDPIISVRGDLPHISRRVREFLYTQARNDISAAVARHCAVLGVSIRGITIRDTRSRWGSCSAKGRLSFSWRLIMAPPLVLNYLAAHEVAHLREMNHSSRFWRLTHELCPETAQAEAWLKHYGTSLHRYG